MDANVFVVVEPVDKKEVFLGEWFQILFFNQSVEHQGKHLLRSNIPVPIGSKISLVSSKMGKVKYKFAVTADNLITLPEIEQKAFLVDIPKDIPRDYDPSKCRYSHISRK